jgi:hypothetical protein
MLVPWSAVVPPKSPPIDTKPSVFPLQPGATAAKSAAQDNRKESWEFEVSEVFIARSISTLPWPLLSESVTRQ